MDLVKIEIRLKSIVDDWSYESLFISKETYLILKDDIENINYRLDSLCWKAIYTTEFSEKVLLKYAWKRKSKGNLYEELKHIFQKHDIDIDDEIEKVYKYLDTLDTFVIAKFALRKSQMKKVKEFVETLQ